MKVVFKPAKWPENLKAARAGKVMMWRLGTTATASDGQQVLQRLFGPEKGQPTSRASSSRPSTRCSTA
jgi:hypothetical protein